MRVTPFMIPRPPGLPRASVKVKHKDDAPSPLQSIFQSKNDPEIGYRFQYRMILKFGTPSAGGFPF
jgi:hypothetical protein